MIFGRHINRYYIKYAGYLLLGLVALIAVDYIQLLIPNLYQIVINGVNDGYVLINGQITEFNTDLLLDRVCLPLTIIMFVMVVGRFLWRIGFIGSGVKVEADLRNRMFDHAKNLSREYYQTNKVGNIMSLFTNDLDTIFECFGWGLMMFFDAIFMCVLVITKMMRMDVLLACLSLIPMVLLLCAATIIGKYMTIRWDARQEAFSRLSDFSQESFSGIAVVKAFVKEGAELLAFRKLNRENEEANISFTRLSVLLRIVVMLLVESVVCVILGYGGFLVYKGVFNAGQLVEFIGYFTSIVWPIMAVTELIDMSSRGRASLKRVSELLDARQDVADREGAAPLTDVKGGITFKDLSFRYPDGEFDALEHLSFHIEPGENVGLVGKTGSGKTTLVDLILRTYNVADGTLFIDGHDVNDVRIADVRAACAYVPQENFLFSDTIERNIAFGVDGRSFEEIEGVSDQAGVGDNIRGFNDGFQTMCGERGVTLSGGQKQRISIARALLKDTPILILDDSVSAVDTQTEKQILENLRRTRAGRTTILIAHRISTIEHMDKIIYIDDGKLVAVGTHEELYASCPDYRKTVDLQRLDVEGGSGFDA